MNPSETFLKNVVDASEGTRKEGFTTGGVSFSVNQSQDTVTGTFTIPVTIATNATGQLIIADRDFLELPPVPL